jgi:hypothetical protein
VERGERVGQNEAIFRNVNEQIESISKTLSHMTQTMDIVCECGDISCAERLMITVPAYERVRAESTLFVLLPGHEMLDIEEVVDAQDGYRVVRKQDPDAREVAEESDPRSD